MTDLKDSGERVVYETGGTREPKERRCDLLPLDVIAEHLDDGILFSINKYIREGNVEALWIALNTFIDEATCWTFDRAMLEVSIHYGQGAKKYADRNWELGIPLHSYIDSGLAHYFKFNDGLTDEPHDRAFIWNMLGAIWTHKHFAGTDLIDLPFALKQPVKEKTSYTYADTCMFVKGDQDANRDK
jgi:hypothetical protein